MVTTRKRLLYIMVGCALGHMLIGAKPLVAQGDCKPVLDAITRVISTPAHVYVTMNVNGKPQIGESIYTPGAIYVKVDGKWSVSPLTPQEMAQQQQKNIQNSKATCTYWKDELVNGELAAVYSTHNETPGAKSDTQLWVSKGKGLTLRSDSDLVGSTGHKTHSSTRYEYGDVKPPM